MSENKSISLTRRQLIGGSIASAAMLHGQGHYHETYKKIDGRWLIHTLRITRLHVTSSL